MLTLFSSGRVALAALAALFCGLGCSASVTPVANATTEAALNCRAQRAFARLTSAGLPERFHLTVEEAPAPTAFSWASGDICVSRGLVGLLDDDELTAVIAHELGHLTGGGGSRAALLGGTGEDDEARADARAIVFLREIRVPPIALAHALAKVSQSPRTPQRLRGGLEKRILRIEAVDHVD